MAWISVRDAASRLGLSIATVYALCAAGKLRHRRIGVNGGRIKITEADLALYLAATEVDEHNAPAATQQGSGPSRLPVRRGHHRPDGKPLSHLGL